MPQRVIIVKRIFFKLPSSGFKTLDRAQGQGVGRQEKSVSPTAVVEARVENQPNTLSLHSPCGDRIYDDSRTNVS
jgi:hypothetical protein